MNGTPEHVEGLARHVVEAEPGDRERRDVAAVEAAGDRLGVDQHVLAEEDQPERGDAEVDAPQAGGDRAEQQARHAGGGDGQGDGDERRQAPADRVADAGLAAAGRRRSV